MPVVVTSLSLQSIPTLLILIALAAAARPLVNYVLFRFNKVPYPPGPKPRWLVGNLFDIPTKNIPQEFANWAKKYNSDIVHASALGNHIIVLNKRADVEELFERRAAIYSDRAPMPMSSLIGWDYNFAFLPYGAYWRLHRKICKQNFGQASVRKYYEPLIASRVGHALRGLAQNSEMFEECCKTFSVSIPLMSMCGYSPESMKDPLVSAITEAVDIAASLLMPGATLLNILPFLRRIPTWVPGTSARRLAEKARSMDENVYTSLINNLRTRTMKSDGTLSASDSELSLIGRLMSSKARGQAVSAEEEEATHNVARTTFSAATDTTTSSTVTFIYLMAVNSEVQRKAQAEIDQIVGADRLPDLGDRESLPYVEAIYREVMRWKPPLPIAAPHHLREDDYYKGYLLPKGSIVFSNLAAICNDEEFFPDPYTFKPERFFDDAGALLESDPYIAFGIGRRTCPGVHLGSASMWLFIASILTCFSIRKSKDPQGREIEIEDDYVDLGVVQHKKHFECSITPRSEAARELIMIRGTAERL